MSKFLSDLGGTTGAFVAGGGVVVVLALGAYIGFGRSTVEPLQSASDGAAAEVAPATQAQQSPSTQSEIQPGGQTPVFDEVRRDTDGTTLIAGRAAPDSSVKILVDGAEVASVTADSTGGFAAIALLPSAQGPQVVSLSAQLDEAVILSDDEIILAPFAAVKEAAPQDSVAEEGVAEGGVALAGVAEEDVAQEPAAQAPVGEQAGVQATVGQATSDAQITEAPKEQTANTPAAEADAPVQGDVAQSVVTELDEPAPAQIANAVPAPKTAPVSEVVSTPEATSPPVSVAGAAPAPAAVAVLKSDAQGVRLLASVPPSAMTAIALDTIGYSDVGDVQLSGRAQPDTAKVRVYLDNRSVVSLPVDAQGRWRGDLPNVDEGVYTLRVDEVSAAGAVSSRVETPFKRESVQTLAQAGATQDGPVRSITVQTGATLWAIARARYGDGTLYVRVFEANADAIRDPDLIYPGQIFDLPN